MRVLHKTALSVLTPTPHGRSRQRASLRMLFFVTCKKSAMYIECFFSTVGPDPSWSYAICRTSDALADQALPSRL